MKCTPNITRLAEHAGHPNHIHLSYTNRMDRYRRSYRCTNRIVNERIEKRTLAIHKKKLKTTRRSVDNETPSSYGMPHLKKNLKKAQMLEDRYTEIEKQNRTLLAKMHSIMRNPSATTDNHNNYKKYSKSLNIRRRRENLDRIVHNNLVCTFLKPTRTLT